MIYKTSTMNQPLSFLAGDSLSEATTYATENLIFAGSRFEDTVTQKKYIWNGTAFTRHEPVTISRVLPAVKPMTGNIDNDVLQDLDSATKEVVDLWTWQVDDWYKY